MANAKNLVMPANYAAVADEEMVYTEGGATLQTIAGGVAAVGAALALTYIGGAAAQGIGSLLGDNLLGNFIGGVGSLATGIIGGGASLIAGAVGSVFGGVANAVGAVL